MTALPCSLSIITALGQTLSHIALLRYDDGVVVWPSNGSAHSAFGCCLVQVGSRDGGVEWGIDVRRLLKCRQREHTHTHMGCVRVLFLQTFEKKCVSHQQRQPVSGRLYCKNNSTRHFFSFFFGGVGLRPMRHGGVPGPMLTALFFRRDSTPHQRNPAPRGHRANFVWRVVCKCSDKKKRSIFLKVDCQLKHARN